jgi:hypothetical protein
VLRYFQVVAAQAAEDLAADTWGSVIRGLRRFWGDEGAFPGLGVHRGPPPGHRLAPPGRASANRLDPSGGLREMSDEDALALDMH